jgi:hypothetical protein
MVEFICGYFAGAAFTIIAIWFGFMIAQKGDE